MSINIESLMEKISIIRRKKGITQEELATHIDKSVKFIGDLETGRRNPSIQTFIDICLTLEIDMNELFYGGDKYE